MPIDPRIALGVQPVQLQMPDPNQGMNALARAMQIRGMQDEQQVNALKLQEMQRGVDETNRLNQIYSGAIGPDGAIDRNKLFSGMATGSLGSRIPDIQKKLLDADKAQADLGKVKAETGKIDFDMGIKRAEHAASVLSLAKDPQSYATVRAVIKNQFGQDLPEQFDPAYVQAEVAKGMTIAQQLADLRKQQEMGVTMRGQDMVDKRTREEGAANRSVTMRGQNMTDARARELNAQGKTQIVETPQGFVLVDKQTGASRPALGADGQPLKGKANDRVMTESQAKANLFGTRMKEADRLLTELSGKFSPGAVNAKMAAEGVPVIGGVAGYTGNLMLSGAGQQAEQAQRDFVNAVLRRESGAAISASEFENARKQYFEQPGDLPAVKAQKAANRRLAIAGMEAEVPGGFRAAPSLTNPTGNTGGATGSFSPDIDALVRKYGGK